MAWNTLLKNIGLGVNMKIGIIGVGFVGNAVRSAYEIAGTKVVCIDPDKGYNGTYSDLFKCDGVFVCVPSPVADDGSCDTSYLEEVLQQLEGYTGVIISKVTAPPSTYMALQTKYKNLVHSPEFLTAANANSDYMNGTFAIIGGLDPYVALAKLIIVVGQPKITARNVKRTSIGEASLAKYAINTFLATKVIFYNELHTLAQAEGLDYNVVKEAVALDVRQGTSHFDVPGPDGEFGFGGACFPKDTSAIIYYANSIGVDLSIIKAAVDANGWMRYFP